MATFGEDDDSPVPGPTIIPIHETCEETAAANPTAEYNDQWGDPARFLTAVYQELSEDRRGNSRGECAQTKKVSHA